MYKKIFLLLSVMSFAMQTDFLTAAYKTPPPLPRRPGEQPPPLPPRRQLPMITKEASDYFIKEVNANWNDVDALAAALQDFNTKARPIFTISAEVEEVAANAQDHINKLRRPVSPKQPRRPVSPPPAPPAAPAGDVDGAMAQALIAAKNVVNAANTAGRTDIADVWQTALSKAGY